MRRKYYTKIEYWRDDLNKWIKKKYKSEASYDRAFEAFLRYQEWRYD